MSGQGAARRRAARHDGGNWLRLDPRSTTYDGFDPARAARAADVAHDYVSLMGLASVAYGCGFLAGALSGWPGCISLGGVLLGGACQRWYRHRFGAVVARGPRSLGAAVCFALGLIFPLVGALVDVRVRPPVSVTLLAMALLLGGAWVVALRRVGLTVVHWAAIAAMVAAALAPAAGLGDVAPFSPYVLTVVGCALMVVGAVDHVRLVRAMPPAPTEPDTSAGDQAGHGAQAQVRL